LHRSIWNPDEKLVPKLICVCCFLRNIMLEHTDIVDGNVPLVGHHDECKRRQISRQVINNEVEGMKDAIIEHLALLIAHANSPNKVLEVGYNRHV
jgi:hypothetical protein